MPNNPLSRLISPLGSGRASPTQLDAPDADPCAAPRPADKPGGVGSGDGNLRAAERPASKPSAESPGAPFRNLKQR